MKEFVTIGYTYNELSEEAKEAVKQWYLNDPSRGDLFHDSITYELAEDFKRSNLEVSYSLTYRQGDGLNIHGTINLYDFLEKWEASEKNRRAMEYYIDNSINTYSFANNNQYGYSCKFIDRKYVEDDISEFVENLTYNCIRGIKYNLINTFYHDLIDYFEELDRKWEKFGYEYLYEVDDEEVNDVCDANEWYFDENGGFIA